MANEKRLIDANALTDVVEHIDWYHISLQGTLAKGANSQLHTPLYKADDIYQAITDAPTVDAVEVVHGRCNWCNGDYHTKIMATAIRYHSSGDMDGYEMKVNYCPNCGAKMDGDGNG